MCAIILIINLLGSGFIFKKTENKHMLMVGFVWLGVIILQLICTYGIFILFALAIGKPIIFNSYAPIDILKTINLAVLSVKDMSLPYTICLVTTTLVGDIVPPLLALKSLGIIPSIDIFSKPKTSPSTVALYTIIALGSSYIVSVILNFIVLLLKLANITIITPSFDVPWDQPIAAILMILVVVVFGPFAEEFLCRGVILTVFKRFGNFFAIVASSLIWALLHGNLIQGLPVFMMGIILGILTIKANSIIPSIIIHSINNLISLLMTIAVSAKNPIIILMTSGFSCMVMVTAIALFFVFRKKFMLKDNGNSKHGYLTFFSSPTIIIGILFSIYMLIKSFKLG